LDNYLNVASADKTPIGDNTKLANVMELYMFRMKQNFDAEVRMVGFLRERAISLNQKVPSLVRCAPFKTNNLLLNECN